MLLQSKVAIVTGGAQGIGRAIAERMSQEGATVIVADSNEVSGREVVAQLVAGGGKAWFVPVDVTSVQSIKRMVERSIKLGGAIDILVNNAGVTKRIGLFEMTEEQWDWIQSVNSKGLFFCLQTVAMHMRERRQGKIVNISSLGGKGVRGTSNPSYAASKAAAIVIARVAAAELGEYNINVNSVCPGPTQTEMLADLERVRPDIINAIARSAALGRVNQPRDVADVVVFLSSKLADNITGQSINVDNGTMWD